MKKALVLLSGGLDSMLAVKVLQAQGIEVTGVCFASNFFGCAKGQKAAAELGIELMVVDIKEELLDLVKNPPSGYGKNLNPCIDCHSLMLRRAGEIASREGFDIVATGEVLGQRPFSQNKNALMRVKELSGVEVLRPLSAKLLPETEIEKEGLVNRGRLLDISGRNRDRQMELVEKYGIKNFESPGGGCLLTDPGFSERGIKMLDNWPDCSTNDIELLKYGRIFWLANGSNKILVVIGRHKEDNDMLQKLAQNGDFMIELKEMTGPVVLVRSKNIKLDFDKEQEIEIPEKLTAGDLDFVEEKNNEEILMAIALLTGYYATKARGKRVKFNIMKK